MAEPTTQYKTAEQSAAQYKLDRHSRCLSRGIKPVQTDDGTVVCLNDQIRLLGQPYRHDVEELRLLRTMAGTWPTYGPRDRDADPTIAPRVRR